MRVNCQTCFELFSKGACNQQDAHTVSFHNIKHFRVTEPSPERNPNVTGLSPPDLLITTMWPLLAFCFQPGQAGSAGRTESAHPLSLSEPFPTPALRPSLTAAPGFRAGRTRGTPT